MPRPYDVARPDPVRSSAVTTPETYADLGEAAWRWVLDQVRWDDEARGSRSRCRTTAGRRRTATGCTAGSAGSRTSSRRSARRGRGPTRSGASRTGSPTRIRGEPADHDGVLATSTDWSATSACCRARGRRGGAGRSPGWRSSPTDDGWEQPWLESPPFAPHSRINDATLGTAVTCSARSGRTGTATPGAEALATPRRRHPARRGRADRGRHQLAVRPAALHRRRAARARDREMPNWSHGLAGIAAALAVAGAELGRPDLVEAARSGAEHLVTLGDTSDGGFVVPHVIPDQPDMDEVTYTWCHGPTGTSLLFTALEHAGRRPRSPGRRRRSGSAAACTASAPPASPSGCAPASGTTTAAAAAPPASATSSSTPGSGAAWTTTSSSRRSSATRSSSGPCVDGDRACWRFTEHRNEDPLLPPGVGWMQGTAGIAAYLLRLAGSSARDVRRPLSRASTPGGTCRDRTSPHLRVRRRGLRALPPRLSRTRWSRGAGVRRASRRDRTGDRRGHRQGDAGVREPRRARHRHRPGRRRCSPSCGGRCPAVRTVRATFEEVPLTTTYDLVYAAAALHWTRPEGRWERAAALLEPGGVVASFGAPRDLADPVVEEALRVAGTPWLQDDRRAVTRRHPGGQRPAVAEHGAGCLGAVHRRHPGRARAARPRCPRATTSGSCRRSPPSSSLPPADREAALASILDALPAEVDVVGDIRLHLARRA